LSGSIRLLTNEREALLYRTSTGICAGETRR
jgi:hypothetical protein